MSSAKILQELVQNDLALKDKLVSKNLNAKRSRENVDDDATQLRAEVDRLTRKVASLTKENEVLKSKLRAHEPSAEDAAQMAEKLRESLSSKIGKAMSVWKNACNGNGARFNVEMGCQPAVLASLVGEKVYTAATKGAKAHNAHINLNLNTEEKIIDALHYVPSGSVRYARLFLKVGGTSGLKFKLEKATNTLVVSGVYGKGNWEEAP